VRLWKRDGLRSGEKEQGEKGVKGRGGGICDEDDDESKRESEEEGEREGRKEGEKGDGSVKTEKKAGRISLRAYEFSVMSEEVKSTPDG